MVVVNGLCKYVMVKVFIIDSMDKVEDIMDDETNEEYMLANAKTN